MPLCYGGGVKTVEQAARIIGLGAEKVAISSAAIDDPELIVRLAEVLGSQSIVVVLDVRRTSAGGEYEVWRDNARKPTGFSPFALAQDMASRGAGEIVINSIDKDGEMSGYDIELMSRIRDCVSVPITALGGAGSLNDIGALIGKFVVIGAAAGSLFVFKGVYRAVLISYPSPSEKDSLIRSAGIA